MAKEQKEPKEQIKRESVSVRLSQDAIILGRSLARALYGAEDKLGLLMEDALNYYSAHREDEARASAILKTTESSLFKRFSDQVEDMYKSFTQRDNKLTERIAGLLAVSSFETALTELMLKDLYCRDEKTRTRYEELRSTAARKMKDRYEKANVTEVLELQEKVRSLEKEVEEWKGSSEAWEEEADSIKSQKAELKEKYDQTVNFLTDANNELKKAHSVLRAYALLANWYEKRDKEIPEIQEQNKKFLAKQPYEEALQEFDMKYPKPQVPRVELK